MQTGNGVKCADIAGWWLEMEHLSPARWWRVADPTRTGRNAGVTFGVT